MQQDKLKSRLTQNKINNSSGINPNSRVSIDTSNTLQSETNNMESETEKNIPTYTVNSASRFKKREKDEIPEDYIEISSVFSKPNSKEKSIPEEDDVSEITRLQAKNTKISTKIVNGILVALCIYVLILIYGVFVTDFIYSDKGTVVPQVMTVEDIREKENYEVLLGQYKKCRMLYEQVLIVDYRIAANVEDPLILAPEYEKLIDGKKNINTKDLDLKTEALEVDPKYSYMKNDLSVWLGTDMATYLRSISAAITKNNPQALEEAIVYRDKLYYDFSKITENMVAVGENLNGVDVSDLKTWTPEQYIEDYKNGKVD